MIWRMTCNIVACAMYDIVHVCRTQSMSETVQQRMQSANQVAAWKFVESFRLARIEGERGSRKLELASHRNLNYVLLQDKLHS